MKTFFNLFICFITLSGCYQFPAIALDVAKDVTNAGQRNFQKKYSMCEKKNGYLALEKRPNLDVEKIMEHYTYDASGDFIDLAIAAKLNNDFFEIGGVKLPPPTFNSIQRCDSTKNCVAKPPQKPCDKKVPLNKAEYHYCLYEDISPQNSPTLNNKQKTLLSYTKRYHSFYRPKTMSELQNIKVRNESIREYIEYRHSLASECLIQQGYSTSEINIRKNNWTQFY